MQHEPNVIPPFNERGNLPTGTHKATIDEIVERFGGKKSLKRSTLCKNLKLFFNFAKHYVTSFYIDGSFVTSKLSPSDVDILVIFPNRLRFSHDFHRQLSVYTNNYAKYKLHIFPCFESDLEQVAGWQNWFTMTEPDENKHQFVKGIISLEIK